jgi:ABC-type multidrug transport system fused ATPase/permease subunit
VSRDIEFDIRNDLLKRLLLLEPEFYVRNRTGELMSRATNDLNAVRMVLGPGIMYSATTIVTMIFRHCGDDCPVAVADAVGAAAGAGGGGSGVVFRPDDP